MKIRLHIERVVLEGLELSRAEAKGVRASLEAQLTQLLAGGLAPQFLSGGAYSSLPGLGPEPPQGTPTHATPANTLGSQVAQAVYGGIGRSE